MKLSYRIISRISIALLILFSVWASLFYFIIIEEISDETDDSLEDYSEYIIIGALTGKPLPSENNGSNNSYIIKEVSPEYSMQNPAIRYYEEMIYIEAKKETEPARILKTIFRDAENKCYELTVSTPTIEKQDLQETILWWIVFLYVSLLLLIIGINMWILHRSFKPLYVLLKWLDDFGVEKKIRVLDNSTKITEFRKLNEAMIRAAYRNIETYEQQKSFIEHASHELQTPLAVCLNKLELLMDDPDLNENQLNEIYNTIQSLNYIIKLNKTLLLLTKIENNQFPDQKRITVNDLVKKIQEDYSEVYAQRNISVVIQEDSVLKTDMNEILASILFGNLMKNAYLHNIDDGSIQIRITSSSFIISNTGTLEALDSKLIFNRFYQGAKKDGSTGLGLALSKTICKLYGIDIKYHFDTPKHIFTLSF